jgi:hypothetical protein
MLEEQQYQLTPEAEVALTEYIKNEKKTIICKCSKC